MDSFLFCLCNFGKEHIQHPPNTLIYTHTDIYARFYIYSYADWGDWGGGEGLEKEIGNWAGQRCSVLLNLIQFGFVDIFRSVLAGRRNTKRSTGMAVEGAGGRRDAGSRSPILFSHIYHWNMCRLIMSFLRPAAELGVITFSYPFSASA